MPPEPRRNAKSRSGKKRPPHASRPGSGTAANPTLAAIQSIDWDDLGKLFGSRAVSRGER